MIKKMMKGRRKKSKQANPKKWLSAACFANSVLGGVEFLIPHLLPKASWMALAICTNVGKMTGYLVIGASRAVLQRTLASGDNLGEVTLGTNTSNRHRCSLLSHSSQPSRPSPSPS